MIDRARQVRGATDAERFLFLSVKVEQEAAAATAWGTFEPDAAMAGRDDASSGRWNGAGCGRSDGIDEMRARSREAHVPGRVILSEPAQRANA